MIKDRILAELKKKFPGLSNELLGLLAEKLSVKITEEDKIQGGIAELDNLPISISDYAQFLQKESDRRVSDATKTHEKTLREKFDFKEKGAPNPKTDPATPPAAGDEELKTQLASLSKKIEVFEKKQAQQAIDEAFIKKLTEKKIPISFARGRVIESAEQIDTVLAEVEKEYDEIKQGLIDEGLRGEGKPLGGTNPKNKNQASDKELEEVMSNLKM